MQFLKTYRKVRKVFRRPKLHLFIGRWRNYPGLPVWRVGNHIRLWKVYDDYRMVYQEGWKATYVWSEQGKKTRPFISRFLPPVVELPTWLSFHIFDEDIHWKTKWTPTDVRYEYPTQLCFVFFGLCLAVWATAPNNTEGEDSLDDYDYWETILKYLHCYNRSIVETAKHCGFWQGVDGPIKYQFLPEYLRNKSDMEIVGHINNNHIKDMENKDTKK